MPLRRAYADEDEGSFVDWRGMRGCGSRESTPPGVFSSPKSPRFEAKFYEWQALCHVASCLGRPVLTNVRDPRPGTGHFQSPEVDGVIEIAGRRILVEAKSYGLTRDDVRKIVEKYKTILWDELLLVAPLFHQPEFDPPANVRLLAFAPNLSLLRRRYFGSPYSLPSAVQVRTSLSGLVLHPSQTGEMRNKCRRGIRVAS